MNYGHGRTAINEAYIHPVTRISYIGDKSYLAYLHSLQYQWIRYKYQDEEDVYAHFVCGVVINVIVHYVDEEHGKVDELEYGAHKVEHEAIILPFEVNKMLHVLTVKYFNLV